MEWVVILKRNFIAWSKTWYSVIFSSLEILIFILGFGIGLNTIVGEVNGVKYIDFILPSVVIIPSMNNGFFETTYNSFSKMYYRKMFHAYLNTPAGVIDIYLGELLWAVIRGLISSAISIIMLSISGLVEISLIKILTLFALSALVGICFSSLGLLLTAIAPSINFFDYFFYVYISPIMFLSGTFFPLDVFPDVFEGIAFAVSPLYHGLEMFRNGGVNLANLVYLIIFTVVLVVAGIKALNRRLID
ncbi:MAG: ABC transporter permease [Spirochaetia bacterium]|nr:ABC transporter permease [Spirochaetota bacterium]MDW8113239.1 ABC transporter permease [Spirochaetia bacterium]